MSTKKIVLWIGIALLAFGACLVIGGLVQIKPYQEEQFDRSRSEEVIPGVRNDLSNLLGVRMRNEENAQAAKRSFENALPYIVVGIGTIIAGLILGGVGIFTRSKLSERFPTS